MKTVSEYLEIYGDQLADRLRTSFDPLHVPGRDSLPDVSLLMRKPFPAQHHAIAAITKCLNEKACCLFVGACGTGKTFTGTAAVDTHANGKPYRGIVMCPPHLGAKWKREIENTVKFASVQIIDRYWQLIDMQRERPKPSGAEWYVITGSTAKLGTGWQSSFGKFKGFRVTQDGLPVNGGHNWPICNACGAFIYDTREKDGGGMLPMPKSKLDRAKHRCKNCDEPLWQWTSKFDRWPVASFIHRRMRGMFDYLLLDELQDMLATNSAIAVSMSQLVKSCKYTVGLTGTLMGGYAKNLFPMLWRIDAQSMLEQSQAWSGESEFTKQYGRIERTITIVNERFDPDSNRHSRGTKERKGKAKTRPGIMPSMYSDFLLDKTVFLSLDEVATELPDYQQWVKPIELDDEIKAEYRLIEDAMRQHMADLLQTGSRSALSRLLQCLIYYPDHPYGWGEIGYYAVDEEGNEQEWVTVCCPKDLSETATYAKQQDLIDSVVMEHKRGRKSWVYVQQTGKRDLQPKLQEAFARQGLRCGILRAKVKTTDREEWIEQNGRKYDVMISHPDLVRTGLELFGQNHNYPAIHWYQTGWKTYTVRQASCRAWRIGQKEHCSTGFYFYAGTMQAQVMDLMGRKIAASESIEGKFSSEGLASLMDDSDSIEMELAKAFAANLKPSVDLRNWTQEAVKPEPQWEQLGIF